MKRPWLLVWLIAIALIAVLVWTSHAFAGEGYQDRPTVCDMPQGPRKERCLDWVQSVKTPDTRTSCCGAGDTYMADNFRPGPDGGYIAVISANYPDGYGGSDEEGNLLPGVPGFKIGDEIFIPRDKINFDPEDANRSGHGVFFYIGTKGNGRVVCAFLPALI